MVGLLVSTVLVTAIVAVALAGLVAVTVAPLYVALEMADTRRFSTGRWTLVSAMGIVLGLGYAYVLHRGHPLPLAVTVLPLALTWIGPGLLWLLEPSQERLGGRAGAHE
jgi:multidrug efflux pump subunit AcrB